MAANCPEWCDVGAPGHSTHHATLGTVVLPNGELFILNAVEGSTHRMLSAGNIGGCIHMLERQDVTEAAGFFEAAGFSEAAELLVAHIDFFPEES